MNKVTAKSRHFFAFSTIKAKSIALKEKKEENGDKSGIQAKRMSITTSRFGIVFCNIEL